MTEVAMGKYALQRMGLWLVVGVLFYVASRYVGPAEPQLQVLLHKASCFTLGSYGGYWVARQSLGRIEEHSAPGDRIARAIVVGLAGIAVSLGM